MPVRTRPSLVTIALLTAGLLALGIFAAACTTPTISEPVSEPLPATEELAGDESAPDASASAPENRGEPLAILTYVEGDVQLVEPSAARARVGLMAQPEPEPKAAQPMQPLQEGDTLELRGESSIITFVCNNNFVQRGRGPTTVRVDPATCGRGRPVPPSGAPDTASAPPSGSKVVQSGQREGEAEYGQIPVIVHPRNTALLAPELPGAALPDIVWVSISDATEYELALSSMDPYEPQPYALGDVTCTEDERVAPYAICSVPWPADWVLTPDARYFLTVSARTGIASPPRESEASALNTLPAAESETVRADVDDINAIDDLDGFTRNLMLGNVYVEHELFHHALLAYDQALAVQPVARLYERQAFLYLNMELYRFALAGYTQAQTLLDAQPEPEADVQAAIELGVGLVRYMRTDFADAIPHIEAALALYTELGMDDAAADAAEVLTAAQERLP